MKPDQPVIRLRGVRVHNLKGIDLDLPTHQLTVFSGVSGSGKSSLAFDTLYAEGQRRYIETFSPYTRQFLERLDKPDADLIDDIPPAIGVGQRQGKRSSRSTLATITEIHDYLALLFARAGRVVCRRCGTDVEPADAASVARQLHALSEGTRFLVLVPVDVRPETDLPALFDSFRASGFARVRIDGEVKRLDESATSANVASGQTVEIVVDRLVAGSTAMPRLIDSIDTAFAHGLGRCRVAIEGGETLTYYRGRRCPSCGLDAPEPDQRLFRYDSPLGACPSCQGTGLVTKVDLARVIPDQSKSIRDGAIASWTTPAYREHFDRLISFAGSMGINLDIPFEQLPLEQVELVMHGSEVHRFLGVEPFFQKLASRSEKAGVRLFLGRWQSSEPCDVCHGTRLRDEARAIRIGDRDITQILRLNVANTLGFLDPLSQTSARDVAQAIEPAIARLRFLERVGLNYLTLDRSARTLSTGESRRAALTRALGSGLVNTLYVLDEPSVGLHPCDIDRLVHAVQALRDAGNTVVVVEHDEQFIAAADHLVDIGPGAGEKGGTIVFQGKPNDVVHVAGSATGRALAAGLEELIPEKRRKRIGSITLTGANGHNLRNITTEIPLGVLCVVTGVSGAGKTTLIEDTLFPALESKLTGVNIASLPYQSLAIDGRLDHVSLVDQSPIGRSPRSNPATYVKVFDEIRSTFASTHEAKVRNYGANTFSFNVDGGRCSTCEGNGELVIDMQFLADVTMRCPDCRGKRYRAEVLEVEYRGKSIADVLELTAREAFGFFRTKPRVQARLRPMIDVGLEYLRLGQPASTLSGGEAQRLRLASFLASTPGAITRAASGPKTLFILNEPTTGLHPQDTRTLIEALNSLLVPGHSVLVVEHSPELMLAADWIIDIGPGAGEQGGQIVAAGTPEFIATQNTPTGNVLAKIFAHGTTEGLESRS